MGLNKEKSFLKNQTKHNKYVYVLDIFAKRYFLIVCTFLGLVLFTLPQNVATKARSDSPAKKVKSIEIQEKALHQIQACLSEKEHLTQNQKKISSKLLYSLKAQKGTLAKEISGMRNSLSIDNKGVILVDIKGIITKDLLKTIESNGEIINSFPEYNSLRCKIPLSKIETIAEIAEVKSIRPAMLAIQSRNKPTQQPTPKAINISEGVIAHQVDIARNKFGTTGAGVKVGVLSDSVNMNVLANLQASGDLPQVTILPGQAGDTSATSEGTAMLEIINDIAPNAQLFFATSANGAASFARNILALRNVGCDIIVDDTFYLDESPFQDGLIAQSVNTVTNDGTVYFSAAGNGGNQNKGTSGVYEGDFFDGGSIPLISGATINIFDGVTGNPVSAGDALSGSSVTLQWSDPLGHSNNDYDLFVLDSSLSTVFDSSTDIQNGDDDPFEIVNQVFPGDRIVVVRKNGAASRFLHLEINSPNGDGQFFVNTSGRMKGHSCTAGAISVAAVNVKTANGAFTGGAQNPIENFSADGPRRIFYNTDGTEVNPGSGFLATGGTLRQKPDITAADGVMTATPGPTSDPTSFNPFFGTSAAAAHAAGIAALVKSFKSSLPSDQIRSALINSALDIESSGLDRNSGSGIIIASTAVGSVVEPKALLSISNTTANVDTGTLNIELFNTGNNTANSISATLTSLTLGVTINSSNSTYSSISANSKVTNSNNPFRFSLSQMASCIANFNLKINYNGGITSTQELNFQALLGKPNVNIIKYNGSPVIIPDNDINGAKIPISVSGLATPITKVALQFEGSSCSATPNATTVGLDHSFIGDLVISLTSPNGTTVTLANRAGDRGNNFCQTVFDDAGSVAFQATLANDAPYSGKFKPATPLGLFNGENPNGTWVLNVKDLSPGDTGTIRSFSLLISTPGCFRADPSKLTAISPNSGQLSNKVMINGTNLDAVAEVRFGGTNAGFNLLSPTMIETFVPVLGKTGVISLLTPNGTINSPTFTVINNGGGGNAPMIANVTFNKPVLSIQGVRLGSSNTKVLVNGQDITSRITGLTDTSITLTGNIKKLNLRKGQANEVVVLANGVASNTFVVNLYK